MEQLEEIIWTYWVNGPMDGHDLADWLEELGERLREADHDIWDEMDAEEAPDLGNVSVSGTDLDAEGIKDMKELAAELIEELPHIELKHMELVEAGKVRVTFTLDDTEHVATFMKG